MFNPKIRHLALVLGALCLSGCAANENLQIETGSVNKPPVKTTLAADPVCVALWAKIEEVNKEGTPERVRKIAEGKTKTVAVKRSSLATMAKLNQMNQDFRAKCSTFTPVRSAQAKPNHVPITNGGTPSTTAKP